MPRPLPTAAFGDSGPRRTWPRPLPRRRRAGQPRHRRSREGSDPWSVPSMLLPAAHEAAPSRRRRESRRRMRSTEVDWSVVGQSLPELAGIMEEDLDGGTWGESLPGSAPGAAGRQCPAAPHPSALAGATVCAAAPHCRVLRHAQPLPVERIRAGTGRPRWWACSSS
jgi:hypothetical protein